MVDLVGIEPTTSSMPWKRAPSCATGPRRNPSILADGMEIVKPESERNVKYIQAIFPINETNCLKFRLAYRKRLNFISTQDQKIMQTPGTSAQSVSLKAAPVIGAKTTQPAAVRRVSLKEPMLIALETLRAHKLRSFLTLLGVILSVSTLIIVVSMVQGANKYVAEKVANFGSNVFLVMRFPLITSAEEFVKLSRRNKNITWEDYEYVRDNMRLAQAVGLETRRNGKVKYKTESIEDIDVRGVPANMGGIDTEEPVLGRYITDPDDVHRANVTMIGNDVAKRFFAGVDPLGKSIYIDGEAYEVVGVAKELGSTFGQSQDGFVYIPIQT